MKKKRFFLPAVLALVLSFGLVACGGGNGDGGEESQTSSQSSSQQQQKINVTAADGKNKLMYGETVQLSADVDGVTWASKAEAVATVSTGGLVTAVSKGSAQITATKDGYKTGTINISVDYPNITVTAADSKTSLLVNETVTLTSSEQGVTWASSDATIASVANGVVTANKLGTATITASKEHFNAGSIEIKVVRPAPTATLHMEDADHYSADGMWGTMYSSTLYGPGEESPVYARSSGNASDGTCIAYMDNGDTEELKFSSNAAVKAELVMMMASRNAVSDMSTVMDVKFNGAALDLAGKAFEGGGDTNTFVEFSFGEVTLANGENTLHFDFKGSSPYMDDLNIYAESAATIAVVLPAAKPDITVTQESITVKEGKTAQIESSLTGLSYKSSNESVATVSDSGLVTGVKEGSTTIAVSKDGYKTIRISVTVTAAEGVIVVQVEDGTSENDAVTFKTSNNLSSGNQMVDAWPTGAILTLNVQNDGAAGAYILYMNARAHGGYQSSYTDDLATCIELKINGTKLNMTETVLGGAFAMYTLGEVNLNAGANTMTIECLTDAPTIDLFRFIPKAA